MNRKKKICLIASSGGHFEQISNLSGLNEEYDVFYVTEKTAYSQKKNDTYYLKQVNRQDKDMIFRMGINTLSSLKILMIERPDVIISTGALSVIPIFILGKIMHKKLIFIESFAKISDPTLTGKFLYRFVDTFIIQWESLRKFYPDAVFLGSIY